ncbi:hypothetical protein [Ruminococcus sp.]|uniref:hypothetical protein n=1 Tax=Ruminococcus sp. TaxID=41978 RepID=UPI001B3CBC03|nr:hypothetical protein [Ruminococcus sp.]MBP5430823.1 hypothetical protein [Ruminococcus sp.]
MKNKKAAIITYIVAVVCVLGLIGLLVYCRVTGRTSEDTPNFTLEDIAMLSLAVLAVPMWIISLLLMKALRLRGTLHERENKMLLSLPALACTGFFIFYGIVLIMMNVK